MKSMIETERKWHNKKIKEKIFEGNKTRLKMCLLANRIWFVAEDKERDNYFVEWNMNLEGIKIICKVATEWLKQEVNK